MTFFGSVIPVPDVSSLEQTNSESGEGSVGLSADQCAAQHGQYPTYILVDYYDVGGGSVFAVAADLNGVTYQEKAMGNGTIVAAPSANGTTNSTRTGSTISTTTGAAVHGNIVNTLLVPLALVAGGIVVLA